MLGIKSKYFLVIPFVLLLFVHYGNGQVISSDTGEADADKEPVACEYGSEEIEILGKADCSKMFCYVGGGIECTYENGEKKTHSMLCSANKNPDGSWICPGACACAVDKDHEYHEAFVAGKSIIFDLFCEGAGILNMASGVLQPFTVEVDRTPLTPLEGTPEDIPTDLVPNPPPAKN